ncbi:hypothetical protein MTR67_051873 [Solanum verrucosum]|uniref:Uncharacterized protein n=1 Tax=Solanum verrucosum TaxID=315347 RepID=A0AAF1A2H5_SOLVR|nr:hypothetical protein MTR67_051873 [Solanum verrucosum]
MAKMMTQLNLLFKHVIGGGLKSMNTVGSNNGKFLDDAKFEALYYKEVQYLGNQMGGSHPSNQRQGGTKVGIRSEIMVGKISEVLIGEIGRWKKIDIFLPVIVNDQRTQLG